LLKFLEENPFAFLTGSNKPGKQVATKIPILMEEGGGDLYLNGYIIPNTDHNKAFIKNRQVLSIFTGDNTYMRASCYTNPQIGSTWNYMSVHISGNIRFMTDEELILFMKKLTLKFENNNAASPTIYDNLPDSFLSKMLPAIAGFEIKAED